MDRFEVQDVEANSSLIINLHSSMDRFEEFFYILFRPQNHNLHSSMDRFEEKLADVFKQLGGDLHSSMDRFEESISTL